MRPGSSSRVPAGGVSIRDAESAGNGVGNGVRREEGMATASGSAGLGAGGVRGALVWTAAASMTIVFGRWVGGCVGFAVSRLPCRVCQETYQARDIACLL